MGGVFSENQSIPTLWPFVPVFVGTAGTRHGSCKMLPETLCGAQRRVLAEARRLGLGDRIADPSSQTHAVEHALAAYSSSRAWVTAGWTCRPESIRLTENRGSCPSGSADMEPVTYRLEVRNGPLGKGNRCALFQGGAGRFEVPLRPRSDSKPSFVYPTGRQGLVRT
jgi:hypothetical protein